MVGKGKRREKNTIEEIVVVSAILIAGIALQFFTGYFNKSFLAFPVNFLLLFGLALLLVVKKKESLKRVASGSLSVILLVAVTLAALWMGLVPGNMVKISWPFVLLYLLVLINLTAVISLRLKRFNIKDISFYLNHLGVLILLFAAGPGSGDKARYFMRVNEGSVEWRAEMSGQKPDNDPVELPIAISLEHFDIDEYPPKIAVINRLTGDALPEGRPFFFEGVPTAEATVLNWDIIVDSLIHRPRMAPHAYVRVTDRSSGDISEGWISCGNYFQHYKTLNLSDSVCVAMAYPEPKRFISTVEVYTQDGKTKEGEIMVNHPMTLGHWKIYQHSYDSSRGRDSLWSVFELVYDPWVIPAYIGLLLMMAGAVTLFWKGGKR